MFTRWNSRLTEFFVIIPLVSFIVNVVLLDASLKSFLFTFLVANLTNLFCWICSAILDYLGRFYLKFRYDLSIPYRQNRLLSYLKGTAFLVPGLIISLNIVRFVFGRSIEGRDFGSSLDWKIGAIFVSTLLAFEAMAAFNEHARQTKSEYERKLYLADLETKKAELALLSAQMNPHFLFNSLNTIAEAIHGDRDVAEDMTINLSDFYRSTMLSLKPDCHLLRDELKICEKYLKMEKYRFGDRLEYSVTIEEHGKDVSDIFFPPLLIQPFVENAVKYGVECRRGHSRVSVVCLFEHKNLVIEVCEEGNNAAAVRQNSGSGTAVLNCKKRLEILFGDDFKIQADSKELSYCVRIKIVLSKVRGLM